MSTSFAFSQDLFIAINGSPMNFYVSRCENADELEEYIQYGGGKVRSRPGPFTVIIEDASQDSAAVKQDSFQSDFIIQCCSQNKILSLKQFRCNSVSLFSTDFDPNDVLHHKISWNDAVQQFKMASEDDDDSVESISEDEEQHQTKSRWKMSRCEFTQLERKRMVEFIVQTKSFSDVMGTALWKRMQQKFKNHTWQSLKEHFLKKTMPMIHTYDLSQQQINCFRFASKAKNPKKDQGSKKTHHSKRINAYTCKEDNLIYKYVSAHADKTTPLGGNQFWINMQKKPCIPGRTWQSVRERYLKFLRQKTPPKNTDFERDDTSSTPGSSSSSTSFEKCVPSSPGGSSKSAFNKKSVPSTPQGSSKSACNEKSVPSTPQGSSTSACNKKSVSSTPQGSSTSACNEKSVPSTPQGSSTSPSNKKSVPSTSQGSSTSPCKKQSVSSIPGVSCTSPIKDKSVPSTLRASSTSVSKESATHLDKEFLIPHKRRKRKLFSETMAVPDFSPISVNSNKLSWLEKEFNNPKSKKKVRVPEIVTEQIENENNGILEASNSLQETQRQNEAEETSVNEQRLPLPNDRSQNDEDVQDSASIDLFASPTINPHFTPSRERERENNVSAVKDPQETARNNDLEEKSGCDQIPCPPVGLQKHGDVQNLPSVNIFASSSINLISSPSRKEDKRSLKPSSSSSQSDQEKWPSNFPPEPVVFISDCESADEVSDEDAGAIESNIYDDSDWSDDGLFWRGGIEFPDGLEIIKKDPVVHLTTLRTVDFNTHHALNGNHMKTRSEELCNVADRIQSEKKKQDCLETRKREHPKIISTVGNPQIGTGRNVTFNFLPTLNNSYDESQISNISRNESEQYNSQSNTSEAVVLASQDNSQQCSKPTTQVSNIEESCDVNICVEPINDKSKSVGVQVTSSTKKHVAVQTDSVLVLPMNWLSLLPAELSSSTNVSSVGCPSPIPANGLCSDSDE